MVAALTIVPVILLFAAIAVFARSAEPRKMPVALWSVSMGLMFLGGMVFLPALMILLSSLGEGEQFVAPTPLSIWLLSGALLLGTGLLIRVGRFSLKVLLCLVLLAALLSCLPILVWGD